MTESQHALRICSAHAECPIKECDHKVPHICEHIGMHQVSECYTAKIHSACLTIVDGKIPKSRWKKCDCCNHSEWITEMIPISPQNASGDAAARATPIP